MALAGSRRPCIRNWYSSLYAVIAVASILLIASPAADRCPANKHHQHGRAKIGSNTQYHVKLQHIRNCEVAALKASNPGLQATSIALLPYCTAPESTNYTLTRSKKISNLSWRHSKTSAACHSPWHTRCSNSACSSSHLRLLSSSMHPTLRCRYHAASLLRACPSYSACPVCPSNRRPHLGPQMHHPHMLCSVRPALRSSFGRYRHQIRSSSRSPRSTPIATKFRRQSHVPLHRALPR